MVMTENQSQPSVNVFPNNTGAGGFGGDGSWGGGLFWIIILFFFAMFTGWGNNNNPNPSVQQNFDQAALSAGQAQTLAAINNVNNGLAELKYTIGTEACATRQAATADTQRVLDKLCQLELDTVKSNYENQLRVQAAQIADLQNQLNRADRLSSQTAQTAQILANNEAQTAALEQYLAPTPRPAYIVQNPNCCQAQYNCCNG